MADVELAVAEENKLFAVECNNRALAVSEDNQSKIEKSLFNRDVSGAEAVVGEDGGKVASLVGCEHINFHSDSSSACVEYPSNRAGWLQPPFDASALEQLENLSLPVVGTLFVARGCATARAYQDAASGPDEYSYLVRLSDVAKMLEPIRSALSSDGAL